MKQTVGDKQDSRSSLCYLLRYPKYYACYYFYDHKETKVFVSSNATFQDKEFLFNRQGGMIELDEVREKPTPQIVEP